MLIKVLSKSVDGALLGIHNPRRQFKKSERGGVRRQIVGERTDTDFQRACRCSPPHAVFLSGQEFMNENRLFVGNLPYQTAENDLQDYFSQAGVVSSVNLMFDKVTGKSRGFAFIEFTTAEEAKKAVEQFHGKEFQGRILTVNIARPREDRGSRWAPRAGGEVRQQPQA